MKKKLLKYFNRLALADAEIQTDIEALKIELQSCRETIGILNHRNAVFARRIGELYSMCEVSNTESGVKVLLQHDIPVAVFASEILDDFIYEYAGSIAQKWIQWKTDNALVVSGFVEGEVRFTIIKNVCFKSPTDTV